MADSTISNLTAKTAPGTGDLLLLVDVSDTTMAATGTDKKTTVSQLMGQAPVQSVAGKTGAVTLANTDISGLGTASTKAASGAGATVASVTGTFTVGHLATFSDTSGTIQDGGAVPSPTLSTGEAITGATANAVLRADASGNLLADGNLTWDTSTNSLSISNTAATKSAIAAGPIALIPDYGGVPRIGIGGTGFTLIASARAITTSNFTLTENFGSTSFVLTRVDNSSGSASGLSGSVAINQTGTASYIGYSWTVTETTAPGGGTHTTWQGIGSGTYSLDRYARPKSGGSTPTIAVGAGAGTGATVSVVGNDVAGKITLNTGTSPAAGTLFTLTYAHARDAAATATNITPGNAAAANCGLFSDNTLNTSTAFGVGSANAPTASGSLVFYYRIEG